MSVEQAAAGSVVAVGRNGTYDFSKPVRDEITLIAGLGVEGDVHAGVTVRHRSRVRADPAQPNLRQVHLMRAELLAEVRADGYHVAPGQLGENVTTSGIDLLDLPCGTILRFGRPTAAGSPQAGTTAAGPDVADATDAAAAKPDVADATDAIAAKPDVADAARATAGIGSRPDRAADAIAEVLEAARSGRLDDATTRAVAALVAAADRAGDDPRPTVVVTGLRNPCTQIDGFRPGLLKRVVGRDDDGNLVRKAGVMGVVLRGGPVRPGDPIEIELPPAPRRPLERV